MNSTRALTRQSDGAVEFDRRGPMSPAAAEKLFHLMVAHQVSRNKNTNSFAYEAFRRLHRRYRVVQSLQREAERLAGLPGSSCRVLTGNGVLQVCLESPTLQYRRQVALLPYEWEWLGAQTGIRTLLASTGHASADGVDGVAP